ncbi:hypothetical protein [Micromonospora tarensis]|uniref:Uncharacterized protein n=1 Tax=Micromonospora tarensis TaxID=2806100 RepID=A0ABS1YDX6_9ACTN|nr:hypothetical protein [Micromonospora tarensis]MBM0275615.1 hypothetical protein [Micromonospora tarensis]
MVDYFYQVADRDDVELLSRIPEATFRAALNASLSLEDRGSSSSEDDAYAISLDEAMADKFITACIRTLNKRVSRAELEQMRTSYQHVLAAKRLGVDAVGADLIEEAVVVMRWAPEGTARDVVDYLAAIFCPLEDRLQVFRNASYEEILVTAGPASAIWTGAVRFRDLLEPHFGWVVEIQSTYIRPVLMHLAILSEGWIADRTLATVQAPGFRANRAADRRLMHSPQTAR